MAPAQALEGRESRLAAHQGAAALVAGEMYEALAIERHVPTRSRAETC